MLDGQQSDLHRVNFIEQAASITTICRQPGLASEKVPDLEGGQSDQCRGGSSWRVNARGNGFNYFSTIIWAMQTLSVIMVFRRGQHSLLHFRASYPQVPLVAASIDELPSNQGHITTAKSKGIRHHCT